MFCCCYCFGFSCCCLYTPSSFSDWVIFLPSRISVEPTNCDFNCKAVQHQREDHLWRLHRLLCQTEGSHRCVLRNLPAQREPRRPFYDISHFSMPLNFHSAQFFCGFKGCIGRPFPQPLSKWSLTCYPDIFRWESNCGEFYFSATARTVCI